MVGTHLATEAANRGHSVIAASRRPLDTTAIGTAPGITPVRTDANDPSDLDAALESAEVAVLTVRAKAGQEDDFTQLTRIVLNAAARAHVRLLVVGGAGPLRSPEAPELTVIDNRDYVPAEWRSLASASLAQLAACVESGNQNWTYLSPPAVLEPGVRTGLYRRGTTTLLTDENGLSRISTQDLAVAIVDEIELPGTHQHITVAH